MIEACEYFDLCDAVWLDDEDDEEAFAVIGRVDGPARASTHCRNSSRVRLACSPP